MLDEATSALDADSEAVVQQAIDNIMKDRTVLVIAHRLVRGSASFCCPVVRYAKFLLTLIRDGVGTRQSTVQNADRLVVIRHGRIAEDGTHADLIEQKGVYFNLVKRQLQGLPSSLSTSELRMA